MAKTTLSATKIFAPVFEPQRILLVGATGRVGRLVLHYWRATPPDCVEIITQHRDPNQQEGFFWPLQEPPNDRLAAQNIDAIVCLAGVTPGPGADLSLNTSLAEAVLAAAHRARIRRVLLASSSSVYGPGEGKPFSETAATAPTNAYGMAKLAMEHACAFWREAGLEVCCLRIGNVAGADALLLNVARSVAKQPITIDRFPDGGGPIRSYIGVATMAEVLCDLTKFRHPLPQVLNIAAPGVVSMEDLARAADHPYVFRPALPGAHQTITLDCDSLAALHDFAADASDPVQMIKQWKETLYR